MPEMRRYIVTQTRQVEVAANKLEDAIRIAEYGFKYGQNSDWGVANVDGALVGLWGNTTKPIREQSIFAERIS